MRIIGISDIHNKQTELKLPEGDVLVVAGDMTVRGTTKEIAAFANWLGEQNYRHKLVVSGNHDLCFRNQIADLARSLIREAGGVYLQDSGVEIDGIYFYGAPWTILYAATAFELPERSHELAEKWNAIPDETNVLITHMPPKHILDIVSSKATNISRGCPMLAERIWRMNKLRAHMFGHLHYCGSTIHDINEVKFANCAVLDDGYNLHNRPIVQIEL